MEFEARENLVLGYHSSQSFSGKWFQNHNAISKHSSHLMEAFDIRPRNIELKAQNFSGGNQQKLVIAREIDAGPRLLIVGQPTRVWISERLNLSTNNSMNFEARVVRSCWFPLTGGILSLSVDRIMGDE